MSLEYGHITAHSTEPIVLYYSFLFNFFSFKEIFFRGTNFSPRLTGQKESTGLALGVVPNGDQPWNLNNICNSTWLNKLITVPDFLFKMFIYLNWPFRSHYVTEKLYMTLGAVPTSTWKLRLSRAQRGRLRSPSNYYVNAGSIAVFRVTKSNLMVKFTRGCFKANKFGSRVIRRHYLKGFTKIWVQFPILYFLHFPSTFFNIAGSSRNNEILIDLYDHFN